VRTDLTGSSLEAVVSRFEDIEGTSLRWAPHSERERESTSTVTSFAETQPAATPPSVQAFDTIVIEAKLKPLVELTKALAPQFLIDQVWFRVA
jgi:adenylyl cyclase-associated protein